MTRSTPPHYELKQVRSDGSESEPLILPVTCFPEDAVASRRGFLGAGVAASAVALSLRSAEGAAFVSQGRVRAHQQSVEALAVSPDGRTLATASQDKTAKLWSLDSSELLKTLKHDSRSVFSLAFSRDSALLASGASDGKIRIWSASSGALRDTWVGHRLTVRVLAASPASDLLASGAVDKTVRLWSLAGDAMAVLDGSDWAQTLAVAPDGALLASGFRDGSIKIWTLPDGRLQRSLDDHKEQVTKVGITANGSLLISLSDDRTMKVWSLPDGKLRNTLGPPWGPSSTFALSPDGSVIATASERTVFLWTMPEGRRIDVLNAHREDVRCLAFSPDSRLLISGDREGVVICWDLADRRLRSYCFDPSANEEAVQGAVYRLEGVAGGRTIAYTLPCGAPIPPGATCTCNCIPGSLASETISRRTETKLAYVPRNDLSSARRALLERAAAAARARKRRLAARSSAPRNLSPRFPVPNLNGPPILFYGPRSRGGGGGGGTYCSCNKVCVCVPVCQAHRLLDKDPLVRRMAEQILLLMGKDEFEYMDWAARRAGPALRRRIREVMDWIRAGGVSDVIRWPTVTQCKASLDHPDEVAALMAAQLLDHRMREGGAQLDESTAIRVQRRLQTADRLRLRAITQ